HRSRRGSPRACERARRPRSLHHVYGQSPRLPDCRRARRADRRRSGVVLEHRQRSPCRFSARRRCARGSAAAAAALFRPDDGFFLRRRVREMIRAMSNSPLAAWHELVKTKNSDGILPLLADDVVFFSPIVHTPQAGQALTLLYLTAAVHAFGNDTFRYVREIVGNRDAVLEFEVTVDGIRVNGVDMIRWNDDGRIVEFKVMLRPLKAINLMHQKMAAMLEQLG